MRLPLLKFVAAVFAVVILVPSHASAVSVVNRALGLAAPDTLIEFDTFISSSVLVIDQFSSVGVSFGPEARRGVTFGNTPSFSGGYLLNNRVNQQPGSIFFINAVSDAVFSWSTNLGITTFSALLKGGLVETFSAASNFDHPSDTGKFYGFENIVFDEISLNISAGNQSFELDNLQFNLAPSAVPVPAALPLFGTGLAIMGFIGWRRKRKVAAAA